MQLKNKLLMMVGNTFMYKTRNHKIIAVKIKDESVLLSSDIDLIELPLDKAGGIIRNKFLSVAIDIIPPGEELVTYKEMKQANVAEVLKDNILKLKTEPGYVKQAMAINNTVVTMLKIVKTEIQIQNMKG